jgi:hypothetical protein
MTMSNNKSKSRCNDIQVGDLVYTNFGYTDTLYIVFNITESRYSYDFGSTRSKVYHILNLNTHKKLYKMVDLVKASVND